MRMVMKKIVKTVVMGALLLVLGGSLGAPSVHAITLGFSPSSQTVNVGGLFTTDVVVSGLETGFDEIISAFDFIVTYDASRLSANPVVFGTDLSSTDPFFSFQDSDLSLPGEILLSELSLSSDADLQAYQGDSVILATLSFTGLGLGTSALDFSFPNVVGLNFTSLALTANAGSVQVSGGNVAPVPEPSTLLLCATGLAGLAAWEYRKRLKPQE